jgi:hypothetical protein
LPPSRIPEARSLEGFAKYLKEEAMRRREKIVAIGIVFRVRIAVISCLVAALVVLPFILLCQWDARLALERSMAIGLLNGVIGPFFLAYVLSRNMGSNAFRSLSAVFVYIAAVCCGSALLFGLADPFLLVAIVAWAEATGLVAAYLIARYAVRLNKKLLQTQERIRTSRRAIKSHEEASK